MQRCWACRILDRARSPLFVKRWAWRHAMVSDPWAKAGLIADLLIPHWGVGAFARCPPWQLESAMQKATTFEHGGKVYEVRAIPTLNGWKVRIFVEGIPANGFTYSVDSEVYQDAAIDGVPEDLVAGLMETAGRDFRRGVAQELVAAEEATDDDIAAENDKFKP